MSQLILNFFNKSEPFGLSMQPIGHCNYEDHITVEGKKAYDLLLLSNYRKKNFEKYKKGLTELLRNHGKITRLESTAPLTFGWQLGSQQFVNTSLFFEYYMASLNTAFQLIQQSLESHDKNKIKEAKEIVLHLHGMFDEWKTQSLILPHVPYVVSLRFLNSLLCFVNGNHTLVVSPKLKDNSLSLAYTTALNSFGAVWPRHPYGSIALQHYLVSRVLLFDSLCLLEEDAGKKLTCANEISKLLNLVRYEKCFLPETILNKVHEIEKNNDTRIDDLVNTDYAVEKSLNDIVLPKTYKLKVCKRKGGFGCKCVE